MCLVKSRCLGSQLLLQLEKKIASTFPQLDFCLNREIVASLPSRCAYVRDFMSEPHYSSSVILFCASAKLFANYRSLLYYCSGGHGKAA